MKDRASKALLNQVWKVNVKILNMFIYIYINVQTGKHKQSQN